MRQLSPVDASRLRGLSGSWALVGARVWPGAGAAQTHDAIAFQSSGRVLACGTAASVLGALAPGSDIVDAHGAFVCPGFVDPHLHVRAAASAWLAGDVSGVHEGSEILAAVRSARMQESGWITLVGADVDSPLTGCAPDRRALDRASRGTPVRIRASNGHGWLLNSAALRRLGVDVVASRRRELAPAGVAVERDPAGIATGFISDDVGWVGRRLGRLSAERQLSGAVAAWSRTLARLGVVAVCDATATNGAAEAEQLLRWRETETLRQEVTFLSAPDAAIVAPLRRRHAGVKFARADDPRLAAALRAAAGRGQRVAVHCVEPEQTAAAIEAAASVAERAPGALRIEHASYVPPDWIGQVRAVAATVVTHPSFVFQRGERYLADPLLAPPDWLYRLRSWTVAGIPVAFASDAPFGAPDPLAALRAAASRRTAGGQTIGAAEALVGEPALAAVTTAAAEVAGLHRLGYGTLARGGPGSAVILTDDPRDPGALPDVELIATVIGGRVVD